MSVTVRFAPSPTGKLHVGNVRAALWNWLFARKSGGKFILRIDDTDLQRSTKEFEQGIKNDLAWLGLNFDETFNQSDRFERYHAAAQSLKAAGLLYRCYETAEDLDRKRKLQRARGLPPVYDRAALELTDDDHARMAAEGRKPHWRFKLSGNTVAWTDLIRGDVAVDTASVSDPVLIREDGMYLYTLPSCVDDIDMGISHVMRGEDHVTNTGVQIEIIRALGGAAPEFAHHSLLVGADGQNLSKRLGDLSIESLRNDEIEESTITSLLARLGTADPVEPVTDLRALADGFDFARVGRAPARFSADELTALNAKILHETPFHQVSNRAVLNGVSEELWDVIKGNLTKISDVIIWRNVVEGEITPVIEDQALTQMAAELITEETLDADSWGRLTAELKSRAGVSGKKLFMPLRLALTGQQRGPEMADLFPLIGAPKAKARLIGKKA